MGFRGQDGQQIGHFAGGLSFEGTGARDLGHMGNARPIRLQVGTEFLADQDAPVFDASPMPLNGLGLLNVSMPISKISRQIAIEGRLIAFDDKERIGVL